MKDKMMIISCILLLFLIIGPVSAINNENETNLNENNVLITEDLDMYYHDGSQFKVQIKNQITNENITFDIAGVSYKRTVDSEGYARLNINLLPGEYKIVTTYQNLSNENKIRIKEVDTILESSNSLNLTYKNGSYSVTLKGINGEILANLPVIFTVLDKNYTRITDENGIGRLKINLNPGTYKISAIFNGSPYYKTSSKITSTINVIDTKYHFKVSNLKMEYKNGKFNVTLLNEKNNPVSGEAIEFTIVGMKYYRNTDINGVAGLNINLNIGNYPIQYRYRGLEESKMITVTPISYSIKSADINASYNDFSYFCIELTKNGENLENKQIKTDIYQNNKLIDTVYSNTYNNGIAKFIINLKPGKYHFKSTCTEPNYGENYTDSIVEVKKGNLYAISSDLKLNRKGEYFKITLKNNSTGFPVANETVEIKICGVSYYRTTDENGIAKLKINLNNGIYTADYEFKENNCFNKIKGTNKITVDDFKLETILTPLNTEITEKGSPLKVKLTDSNQIELKNQKIEFAVNDKIYEKFTDENGIAKLNINLNDGIYYIGITFDGDSLFYKNTTRITLNVNKTSDFNYSFNISTVRHFEKENMNIFRNIQIEIGDSLFKFTNYNKPEIDETQIFEGHNYFISSDYKTTIELADPSNNNKQGILIEYPGKSIRFTYYGRLKDINQFSVIFEEYNKNFFGKVATIVLNNEIKAKIYFSEYAYSWKMFEYIEEKGLGWDYEIENANTVLTAYNFTHDRTINIDYEDSNTIIESYAITDSDDIENSLKETVENYIYFNKNYDKKALENYIISLYTAWTFKESCKVLANKTTCNWSDKLIIQTTSDWNGLIMHSVYDLKVSGDESSKWTFRNIYGVIFSYCEQLGLELAGIPATSATSEAFGGIESGKEMIFEQKDDFLIIRTVNSTSQIVINLTNGDTKSLLGLDIGKILENINCKGCASYEILDESFPKDFLNSVSVVKNGLINDYRNIVNKDTKKNMERFVFNEIRTHKAKVMGLVQSILTFVSPKAGGVISGAIQSMVAIGEYMVKFRNDYATNSTYQYFSYHVPIYNGKTVTVYDKETGYTDYVEIPYKSNGEYDLSKAIYIDGKTGKRSLTNAEKEYYTSL